MSVITAVDVEKANGVLVIAKGDIVTPLARDRAKELGIRLAPSDAPGSRNFEKKAPALKLNGRAAGLVSDETAARLPRALATATAPSAAPRSGALYRRGSYLSGRHAPGRGPHAGRAETARPRVAVVGAGHVGAATAMRLAESDLFDSLQMIDVVDGLAAGLALDIWHGAALRRFTTQVSGSADIGDVARADIVVVTAGRARKPGMTRTDLTVANAEIIRGIADAIRTSAPNAIVVVVTNPLEEMTELMARLTGFPQERVIGMGGVLDTARFKSLVGAFGRVRPQDIDAIVLGSHGAEMVIPLSQATANGALLETLLPRDELAGLVKRTRESGAEVTSLLKTGSAFVSPGSAIARQVEAIVRGSNDVVPACVRSGGVYGLVDTRVGLPVRLGPSGVREIVNLELRDAERRELRASSEAIAARIRALN
jgi:malate dehydrogenase